MRVWFEKQQAQQGYTIVELLVVISILFILISLAIPEFATMKGQMTVSEDIRRLSATLSQLRAEAIRQRTPVRVSFTSSGYSWDIGDDGSDEGSRTFGTESSWSSSTPSDIVFDGLGLVRSATTAVTLHLTNRGQSLRMSINKNGYLEI